MNNQPENGDGTGEGNRVPASELSADRGSIEIHAESGKTIPYALAVDLLRLCNLRVQQVLLMMELIETMLPFLPEETAEACKRVKTKMGSPRIYNESVLDRYTKQADS